MTGQKIWKTISKHNKGPWFIVSAERWACIYQTPFFRIEQVPTPFQRFDFDKNRANVLSGVSCAQSSLLTHNGAACCWIVFFLLLLFLSDRFLIFSKLCLSFAFILWCVLIHYGTTEIPGCLLHERNEGCEFEQLIFSTPSDLTAACAYFFLTGAPHPWSGQVHPNQTVSRSWSYVELYLLSSGELLKGDLVVS